MAISAQRFNFLDRETHVSVKEFNTLTDNAVYNNVDDYVSEAIANAQNDGTLDKLETSINDLTAMLENNDIADTIKNALNDAMAELDKMELPDVAKDILDSVKKLDLQGTKDFFKEMLHMGASFLCNNLDFLKLFMLGYALNKNIMSGLLIALLLSWLDRFCKGFTQEEVSRTGNRGKMNMMFPSKGVNVNSNSAYGQFNGYYSDYLKANAPYPSVTALDNNSFLTNVLSGDINSSIGNLRSAEISFANRNSIMNTLNSNLSLYQPGSAEYSNILKARGQLMNTPLISAERRDRSIRYGDVNNKLGSFIKNLGNVSLPNVTSLSLGDMEKSLFSKMSDLKKLGASNQALQCTPNDSYSNFNFSSVLPSVSTEQQSYLEALDTKSDSHRLNDIHPTSEVFLHETIEV